MQKTYRTLVESYGGDFDAEHDLEYSVLIYNLALTAMDRKNFAIAEKFLSKLYATFSITKNQQPPSDVHFVLDQMLPLLITLNLLTKQKLWTPKVLQWIAEAETKAKQEQDEAAQQRLILRHETHVQFIASLGLATFKV